MARVFNFSAGPAVLPEPVLEQAREAIWDFAGSGMGILELSHRSSWFDEVITSAEARLARLLKLDQDQQVLFLHGGASTQFFTLPMNFLRGGRATYLDTGIWSAKAIKEAKRYGTVDVPFSSKPERYDRVPQPGELPALPEGTKYLHYTTNNTVAGTQFHWTPEVSGDAFLVGDASSDILSWPIEGSKYGMLYAGVQKNMGPSGMAFAVLRKSLLERAEADLPTMLAYKTHADNSSLFNTPNTFAIYIVERVAAWLEENGGLEGMGQRNKAQADKLYAAIDGGAMWTGLAKPESRSWMNITFTTGDADLDKAFVKEATAAGLNGLKGHRSVGGLRASIYNAMPDAGVDALISFMGEFERTRG
ncbi:MAG: 3-phosphoserine/phosphohydroxythreonine transaminase [Deltaproteobacteria bacterium]|nr:3-phosphoserine/phosphohydroxythreonine transaminase [Deltaproteobacteria bacterium]